MGFDKPDLGFVVHLGAPELAGGVLPAGRPRGARHRAGRRAAPSRPRGPGHLDVLRLGLHASGGAGGCRAPCARRGGPAPVDGRPGDRRRRAPDPVGAAPQGARRRRRRATRVRGMGRHGAAVDLRRRSATSASRRPGGSSRTSWSATSRPTPVGWRSSRSASTTTPPSACGRCDGCAGPWYATQVPGPRRRCGTRAAGPGRRRPRAAGPVADGHGPSRRAGQGPDRRGGGTADRPGPGTALGPGVGPPAAGAAPRRRARLARAAPCVCAGPRGMGLGPAARCRRVRPVSVPARAGRVARRGSRRGGSAPPAGCPRPRARRTRRGAGWQQCLPPRRRVGAARRRSRPCAAALEGLEGPVLLVDDLVSSRWTLTVAGRALRRAGAPDVLPFALAVDG